MATVRIYNFNNYYNRKYKVNDALEDYGTPIYTETGSNVNFNPKDGINTNYTAGRQNNPYSGEGDYLIYSEGNTDITSRWFIIEQERNRLGQYSVQLRRDVLADNPSWLQAPTFIEKCTLSPYSPFIYNSEDMSFNEIKTKQTPIFDKTGIPWIVGFYASNLTMGNRSLYPRAQYDITLNISSSELKTSIEDKIYWKNTEYFYSYAQNWDTPLEVYNGLNVLTGETRYKNFTPAYGTNLRNPYFVVKVDSSKFNKAELDAKFKAAYTQYDYEGINKYLNKTIKLTDGYYKVEINSEVDQDEIDLSPAEHTDLWNYFNSRREFTSLLLTSGTQCVDKAIRFATYTKKIYVSVNKVDTRDTSPISFGITDLAVDPDKMPYKAFALPFGEITQTAWDSNNLRTIVSYGDFEFTIANYLNSFKATTDTGETAFELIDCQVVPYCPVKEVEIIQESSETRPRAKIYCNNKQVAFPIKNGETCIGFMYALSSCEGVLDVDLKNPITVNDPKVENQTDKFRLCAGNYTSIFDLNVAKNGGLIGFNLSFTYKPFNSYIKVAPKFGGLYGSNFKDNRGLICSGMSLAKVNDAFNQYRLQNKFYQDIFDRQIENIEVQNKYQRIQQAIGAGVGAFGAGAAAGMLTGSVGAGIGAGVLSGAGGIADYQITKALQNEALDYTKDNFGYNLQNVKAQPNSLSRTADYNIDTQYVPFLEYYTCTNEEKDAFIEKLRFNGMTAMFIGIPDKYTLNTYIFKGPQKDYEDLGYFKGVPIRLEDVSDDYHMAKTIAEELNKGVYLK